MSTSDEEEVLLLLGVCRRRKRRQETFGEFHRLCIELQSHEDRFFKYFRISRESFEELHELLRQNIMKITTNWRKPIFSKE
ncbi:hypothetical protein PR048_011449 [Dryococelus australis]|uniref:Uncharacterized protein n=1 Tax=Dryococelus australis TaxID=614101 RepID=A0ABQ9HLQ3_9NEOP|nr:hypothetical protein PR048_011449 [Dryococelus australis]